MFDKYGNHPFKRGVFKRRLCGLKFVVALPWTPNWESNTVPDSRPSGSASEMKKKLNIHEKENVEYALSGPYFCKLFVCSKIKEIWHLLKSFVMFWTVCFFFDYYWHPRLIERNHETSWRRLVKAQVRIIKVSN